MTSRKQNHNSQPKTSLPSGVRAIIALLVPLIGAVFFTFATGGLTPRSEDGQGALVPLFLGLGIISFFLGLRWYGLPSMGLRGKRPLFASIGFAVLGWVPLLLFRFIFIEILGYDSGFDEFVYRLLFEAFCVQIWAFGLLFHSVADWRGPLTAAMTSGILFGLVAALLFREAVVAASLTSLIYFILWGVLYGIIRLRTGSLIGLVIIQAVQSFTTWVVFTPNLSSEVNQFPTMYLAVGLTYLVIIWRLWPKHEEDYRV